MRFQDKVVVISGAGAGMGMAAGLAFAQEGACIVLNDINQESLNSVADEIRSKGGNVTTVQGDVTKSKDVSAIVEKALEEYSKIDILFNYVGGSPAETPMSYLIEQTESFWDETLDLNLKSTIIFSRAVLDSMIKQKYGKIINTAAAAGKEGAKLMAIYSAAKGGVIAFTKALAREVAMYNINVNCICPGPIKTPAHDKIFADKPFMNGDRIPINRMGTPEEVASAVLYLASDDASFITGQALSIDGGMTMF